MQQDPWLRQKKLHSSIAPKAEAKPKRKWRVLPILWLAFKRSSMLIGALVIISSIAMSFMFAPLVEDIDKSLPDQMVLYMELEGGMGDLPRESSLVDPFKKNNKTVKNYIDALDRARMDSRVEGIYAKLGNGHLSVAHIQELRSAIRNFRKSGKFAYIYSTSYSQGLGGYYLAAAFEEIWLQPLGVVMINGLNAEMPYLRNVLDKIGVEPQIFKRKEYKGAYDMFTESEMPEPSRRATTALITDIADVLKAEIAKDRGISEDNFISVVNKGLLMDGEVIDAKVVDYVDYEDKLISKINEKVTGDPDDKDLSYIKFGSYISEMIEQRDLANESVFGVSHDMNSDTPRVALVYAVGAIMDSDRGSASTSVDDGVAGAKGISKALLNAADDDTIDAVVLRVDSPGGSPVASETILRAVEKIQEKGKTVTVSMGPVAASGGYWIASLADEIFVLPTTITGSIGVLGGKFSLEKLWSTVGARWDSVRWGDNAAMWSMNQPYSESEAERVNAMMDNVYSNFLKRVSKGRNISIDNVDKISRGRVWSGKRAVEIGLADRFGGLNDALDYAAVQAGGKNRLDVDVVILPKPLSTIDQIMKLLEGQVEISETLRIGSEVFAKLIPTLNKINVMQDMNSGAVIYDPINIE